MLVETGMMEMHPSSASRMVANWKLDDSGQFWCALGAALRSIHKRLIIIADSNPEVYACKWSAKFQTTLIDFGQISTSLHWWLVCPAQVCGRLQGVLPRFKKPSCPTWQSRILSADDNSCSLQQEKVECLLNEGHVRPCTMIAVIFCERCFGSDLMMIC